MYLSERYKKILRGKDNMKQFLKCLLTVIIFFGIFQNAYAENIDKTIAKSGINKSAVSVSVKDIATGKTVYKLNDTKPSVPASTLKIVTLTAALDTLGKDYEFTTKLYKTTNNELFIKLGADPFLKSSDLNKLFETAKNKKVIEPKNIYIDDYIFDNVEWGEGWQWDDDLNPLMPKFSSYNIDKNLLNIIISPTSKGAPASIHTTKFYPTTFMNYVITGDYNEIKLSRNNNISPDIITVEGFVKQQVTKQIPVNYLKRYFIFRTEDAVRNAKIEYYGNFKQKKIPSNVYLVSEVKHSMNDAINEVLKNSNNMIAETVFKLAGAKFINNTGSFENSEKMLYAYFDKKGVNYDNIRIVDGSGVSKNNIVTADFMTEFLLKTGSEDLKKYLPTPGEGTLTSRMLYFKDNLYAKTGTHCMESAIAGFITSRSGKNYAFDIMINDAKIKPAEKKLLEEYILRDIYTNF